MSQNKAHALLMVRDLTRLANEALKSAERCFESGFMVAADRLFDHATWYQAEAATWASRAQQEGH